MKSLEARLSAGMLMILLVVFALLSWMALAAVESIGRSYLQSRLEHDAEALLAALHVTPGGAVRMREGRVTPVYRQPLSGHYYQVHGTGGVLLRSRSTWDQELDIAAAKTGEVRFDTIEGPAGQRLLVRVAGYEKDGMRFTLAVAEDLVLLTAEMQRLRWLVLAVLLAALVLALVSQRIVLRRSFRSLDTVRGQLAEVAEGEREKLTQLGPAEIRPLTKEVNRLLVQLQQRLQRSRRSLGNLAHALKGPLSLVMHDLDALPLSGEQRAQTTQRLERLTQLVERELKRARFAGDGGGQRFHPVRDLADLVDALGRIHPDRRLRIVSVGPDQATLPFDREDMLELLGNLLDNACKWAKDTIEVRIETGPIVTLRVSDDGPGIPEEAGADLMRRGVRLDERTDGDGLGLAIVDDLVRNYRGQIRFGRAADLGGLAVVVELPRDDDSPPP
ncbi:MAG: sensor histidine kinase [Gammaproteobacteria bacterium]|nr:sensor histidine kinase [Gammaproteobacteria bacterium]